jgi:hypothetical protein
MNKISYKIAAIVYIPFLFLLLGIGLQNQVSIKVLVRDVFSVAGDVPSYFGLVSNLGILAWCSALTVCCFSLLLFSPYLSRTVQNFFIYSGIISLFLLFDDLFLLHERFYTSHLNLPEKILFIGYGIAFLNYLIQFRKFIFKTQYVFLILALLLFLKSISLDYIEELLFPPPSLGSDYFFLLEDGSKFLGIISWSLYLTSVGFQYGREALESLHNSSR